ncbi:MAG TPA: hypothetical protein ENJ94_09680 [Gammaproteobacteria bacterium]|nr:hypothetical protein [Gammaproteobacteria bacterium]
MGNVISGAGFPTSTRLNERLGDGKPSPRGESSPLRSDGDADDAVQLRSPAPAERPLSRRIGSPDAAATALDRLRGALLADPAQAARAHALDERQVEALLARPPV